MANSDGTNREIVHRWVAPDERGGGLGAPSWSPDGQRLVFQIKQGFEECLFADTDFYEVGIDGSGFRKLLDSRCGSGNFKPTFSPDGMQIAFASKRARGGGSTTSDLDIFVMNADGTDVRQVSSGVESGGSPVWSPDGNWIAFGSNNSGDIWAIDLENGDGVPVKLGTVPSAVASAPGGWSPDCAEIYVTAFWPSNGGDIFVLDVLGGEVQPLTNDPDVIDMSVRRSMEVGGETAQSCGA